MQTLYRSRYVQCSKLVQVLEYEVATLLMCHVGHRTGSFDSSPSLAPTFVRSIPTVTAYPWPLLQLLLTCIF